MEIKLTDIEFVANEEIKNLSSIKNTGTIYGVYYPKGEQELLFIYNFLSINNIKFIVVGKGTNILFSSQINNFFVISLKKMPKKVKKYKNHLIVASSLSIAEAFQYCYKNNLSCFEKLSTVPGSIGGAIMLNAGCFGADIFDNLVSVKILQDGKIKNIKKEKITYEYRKTNLRGLILSSTFLVTKKNRFDLIKTASNCINERIAKQPKGYSLGSIFKNPTGFSAGELIDKCGLKGTQKNDAKISEKHANFIINEGNASYDDIKYLIDLAHEKVKEKFGIDLELEIKIYP